MNDNANPDNDQTFQKLLADCLESLEHGEPIDRDQLRRNHPEHADSICEFLDNNDLVVDAIVGLRGGGEKPVVDTAFAPTMDSHSQNPSKKFEIGDSLRYVGEYEIVDEIARGGMGIVFRARQSKLRRDVALKMILSGRLASEADVDRFHREARAAAALTHPNIVSVHEVGQHEGHHYFTMDFVDGRSLASIISEETLSPRKAAELLKTVALAIEYSHEHGVLHRDLKPANILIDADGQPHVTDFGLAKTLAEDATNVDLTATGQILGTPSYMSPEQAGAKHQLVSVASDVYSLGAILYACLSGRGPFVADSTIDTIRQVIEKEPVALRLLSPQVPRDLETICLKCLQKEPHRRYGTALELADDLDRFLQGRPVIARPISTPQKILRWTKRNPVVASLALLSAVFLISGFVFSTTFGVLASERARSETLQRQRADAESAAAVKAREEVQVALKQEQEAHSKAEVALQSAQWNVYKMSLFPMFEAWRQKQFGLLESRLDDALSTSITSDFRDWEFRLLQDAIKSRSKVIGGETDCKIARFNHNGRLVALRRNDGSVAVCESDSFAITQSFQSDGQVDLEWHPTTNLLAVADGINQVKVWDADTGKLIHEFATEDDSTQMKGRGVTWSPEGRMLALGGYRRVDLFDVNTGFLRKLDCPSWVRRVDWTSDGKTLGVGGVSCIAAINIEANEVIWKNTRNKVPVHSLRWNPQGTVLAGGWSWPQFNITLYQRDSGKVLHTIPVEQLVQAIDWSPDGEEIVTAGNNQRIERWNANDGSQRASLAIHTTRIESMDVNWETNEAITVSNEGKLRRIKLRDSPLFNCEVKLKTGPEKAWCVNWHPSRPGLIAVGSAQWIYVVDAVRGKVIHSFELSTRFGAFDWHPHMEVLAAIDMQGNVIHWNAMTGVELTRWKASSSDFTLALQWSPDAKQMLIGTGQRKPAELNFSFEVVNMNDLDQRIYLGEFGPRSNARFSPDGKRVAVHSWKSDSRLQIWNVAEQRLEAESDEIVGWHKHMDFEPNGQRIVLGGDGGKYFVIDAGSGKILADRNSDAAQIRSIAWSPSGTRLLTSADDRTLRLWDAQTLDLVTTFRDDFGTSADWNANGRQIATCTQDGLLRIWGDP